MIRKLDDISEISSGGTPSRKVKEYWDGTINWLKSQEVRRAFVYDTEEKISVLGMNRSSARKIYPPDTVVLALYGATAGEVALLKTSSTINQAIAALEGRIRECNNHFLFYSLMQNKERLLLETTGAAQQNLYLKMVKEFTIPLPSYEEQCRVASVLSWFDDLIENKKRQNEVLEKTAMAIFKSWFMDFEPFKDEEFVDSPLGKIPKGWYVGTLKEVSQDIVGGSTPLKRERKYWDNAVIPWLTNKEVDYGRINFVFDTKEKVSKFALEETNLKLLPEDCLIISFTASVGKVAINKVPITTNQQFISFIPKANFYLYYTALYFALSKELIESYSGATPFDYITMERALQIPLLIPPTSVLQEFNQLVSPLFLKIALNQKAILVLQKARDALLPLLIFGRLRVEEI